uniref:Pleckstrin homology domain-containing family M member 3 n=1 Tax=Lygus hesperus TaxID=30085 RepID=A0A0A9WKM3_LYGHE
MRRNCSDNNTTSQSQTPTVTTPTPNQRMRGLLKKFFGSKYTGVAEHEDRNDDGKLVCVYCGVNYCSTCICEETRPCTVPSQILWYGDTNKYPVCRKESEFLQQVHNEP